MKGDPVGLHFCVIDFPKGDGVASAALIPVGRNGAPDLHRIIRMTGHQFSDLMERRTRERSEGEPSR